MSEPKWLAIARGEIGVHESPEFEERILEYFTATNFPHPDAETSWCSAYANWCLKQAGIQGTGLANARSFLNWGTAITTPILGCVVVLWRDDPSAYTGHVGFYLGENERDIYLLSGNTDNSVCIMPFRRERLLGYRWPILKTDASH